MYGTKNYLRVHELIVLFQRESMCVDFSSWEARLISPHSSFIGTMNPSRTIDRDCVCCSLQTVNSLKVNRPLRNCLTMHISFFFFLLVNTPVLFHTCSFCRGFPRWRDQKKRSMFRVRRCSLYRGVHQGRLYCIKYWSIFYWISVVSLIIAPYQPNGERFDGSYKKWP